MKKEIDKLAWLYICDGKLLSARSKNKQLFYIPGGKRELGESDIQALLREIKEEVCVDLMPDSIRYANTFKAPADGKNNDTTVKLTCYFADFEGQLCPDAEIEEIKFIDYQNRALGSLGTIKVMDWLKVQNLVS